MNKFFLIICIIISAFVKANEIKFHEVKKLENEAIQISFLLEKVSFIKSYSLVDPSRLVVDVYKTDLKSSVSEVYNLSLIHI